MHIFGMTESVSLEGIYTDVFVLDKISARAISKTKRG
jgi:hypothetical protein